ncbi:MAG: hypothetical protein JWP08_15 [Bryobacterales bacterium]|nr:hypothetical protein [Bryobacterales bacterium]
MDMHLAVVWLHLGKHSHKVERDEDAPLGLVLSFVHKTLRANKSEWLMDLTSVVTAGNGVRPG